MEILLPKGFLEYFDLIKTRVIDKCFPRASKVIDRFHVQQPAFDGVQQARIKYRWEAMEEESKAVDLARKRGTPFHPEVLANGDTVKQ